MIIQFCGLSGAGKSTLAKTTGVELRNRHLAVEIIDGDEYRKTLCTGLGFSKKDRIENIRRMAFVAGKLSDHNIISIICAINPYEEMRREIASAYKNVMIIHIDCLLETLKIRDTKGLYQKALLPDAHPEKILNLTGINDSFDIPVNPDLYINTDKHTISDCTNKIVSYILEQYTPAKIAQKKLSYSL